ncbi:peptidase S8/S53 domain-containing protein [Lactarius sanguifluus]|nr:peptidase S8/S53 domain-containing protein [Lactarius sanguifluus]
MKKDGLRENMLFMFAMLGLLGVSVLISSGNDGIGKGTCVNKDGIVRFIPRFPATCPWVTVVGGTTDYGPEVAARFSGGGFPDHFERPLYQRRTVPTFLENLGNRYQGLYNASGRGIPDIAAQSINLQIFFNGQEQRIVAGIISLLNDRLISTGREPLGFLNPTEGASQLSTTSRRARIRAATWMDSPLSLGGILSRVSERLTSVRLLRLGVDLVDCNLACGTIFRMNLSVVSFMKVHGQFIDY